MLKSLQKSIFRQCTQRAKYGKKKREKYKIGDIANYTCILQYKGKDTENISSEIHKQTYLRKGKKREVSKWECLLINWMVWS